MKDDAGKLQVVRGVVRKLAGKGFPEAKILEAEIEEYLDCGEDPILRIRVFYDKPEFGLDGDEMSSFVRRLRPKLLEIGVHEFPVVFYVFGLHDPVAA